MASAASHAGNSPNVGDHIMVAGLAFQVFTLLLLQILVLDFVHTTLMRMTAMGEGALDPTHKKLRKSLRFRLFLVALGIATFCIFIRSVYRVAELSEGWEGALIKNQRLFIGFEGAMVVVAVLLLKIFHPYVNLLLLLPALNHIQACVISHITFFSELSLMGLLMCLITLFQSPRSNC